MRNVAATSSFAKPPVHAIVQRSNHTYVGRPVKAIDIFMTVMSLEENNRLPPFHPKSPVYLIYHFFYLCCQFPVSLNMCTTWCAQFYKCELANKFTIFLQKSFNRPETFGDALGIVYAVDPYTQVFCMDIGFL